MPRKCAVKCCNNRQKTRSSLIFHSVPTNNPERTNLWLLALNLDPNTPKETVKKMLVCSEHFLRDDYEKMELKNQTKRLLLKETAIPSIGITERVKKVSLSFLFSPWNRRHFIQTAILLCSPGLNVPVAEIVHSLTHSLFHVSCIWCVEVYSELYSE